VLLEWRVTSAPSKSRLCRRSAVRWQQISNPDSSLIHRGWRSLRFKPDGRSRRIVELQPKAKSRWSSRSGQPSNKLPTNSNSQTNREFAELIAINAMTGTKLIASPLVRYPNARCRSVSFLSRCAAWLGRNDLDGHSIVGRFG